MNDNDVIKTLQDMANEYEGNFSNTVLDFINRLQVENERLTEENKEVHSNWQKLKKSYDELSDEAKTEIKRKDKILNSYALQYGTVKDQSKRIEEIKSEARKEFAERLISELYSKEYTTALFKPLCEDIYNLLKELDGKENV